MVSTAIAGPPAQDSITTVLGPKAYRDGDVIEITDVTATSGRLEQGDSLTVRGRFRLESHEAARLCLFVTQTEGDGKEETDPAQTMLVSNGLGEFTLKTTIKHRGVLHVTMYDPSSGKPIGGTYFGTAEQMKAIANWDVNYYLFSDEKSVQPGPIKSEIEKEIERFRREMKKLDR
jgi:hypothetical protein